MATGQNTDVDNSQQGKQQRASLADEEKRVLNECESESFFRRALPLSCGAIFGVQYLVRSGKTPGHPKYGAIPKTIIAGGLAYIFGKISYLSICRKKILEQIPDSNLAMTIRKGQRDGGVSVKSDKQQESYLSQPSDGDSGNYSSRKNKYSSDQPSYEGLNDSFRPSVDNEVKVEDTPEQKKSTTYDDLRQRNRQQYKDSTSRPSAPNDPGTPAYKDSPFMPQKTWPDKPSSPPSEQPPDPPQPPTKRKRTNMWGDVIED